MERERHALAFDYIAYGKNVDDEGERFVQDRERRNSIKFQVLSLKGANKE
jgi:hypothetical protein